jgi:hypothetical protein
MQPRAVSAPVRCYRLPSEKVDVFSPDRVIQLQSLSRPAFLTVSSAKCCRAGLTFLLPRNGAVYLRP